MKIRTEILFCRCSQEKGSLLSFTSVTREMPQANSVTVSKKATHEKKGHFGIRILQAPVFDRSLCFANRPLFARLRRVGHGSLV